MSINIISWRYHYRPKEQRTLNYPVALTYIIFLLIIIFPILYNLLENEKKYQKLITIGFAFLFILVFTTFSVLKIYLWITKQTDFWEFVSWPVYPLFI